MDCRMSRAANAAAASRARPRLHASHDRRSCTAAASPGEPAQVVDAFFKIAKAQDRNPDALVSLLSGQILDAAIDHVRTSQTAEPCAVNIGLDECVKAVASPSSKCPAFIDSFGVRTLRYYPVVEHSLLSSVTISKTEHARRELVVLQGGERCVLTLGMNLENTIQAAYKGITSESQWVLNKISGEWEHLLDDPDVTMGPEAILQRQLEALKQGDVATTFAFASPDNKEATGPLPRFEAMLHSPVYMPLYRHMDAKVLNFRLVDAKKAMALVRVQPNMLLSDNLADGCLYVWTFGRHLREGTTYWLTDAVQAMPAAFADIWPPRKQA